MLAQGDLSAAGCALVLAPLGAPLTVADCARVVRLPAHVDDWEYFAERASMSCDPRGAADLSRAARSGCSWSRDLS